MDKTNIILIGMPGSGKSTCGVLAAKGLLKNFYDTDLLIQGLEQKRLQDIIDKFIGSLRIRCFTWHKHSHNTKSKAFLRINHLKIRIILQCLCYL